ncbi:MAG TPA: epoxyqueuosine reductase, partial [Lachnospiraceae bacterium]|nr:epoxyqueuosine reductase [Lachnospiraceae bacterium]
MFNEMMSELKNRGANFVRVVDISTLPANENQGYSVAILIGIVLSPSYIFRLSQQNILDYTEFSQKERAADHLAEWTADFIKAKKFRAFAQSERNLLDGFYDANTK